MIDPKTRETPPPGIYRGVPAVHYHGWQAASSSLLRLLARETPKHLKKALDEPTKPPTSSQRFGQLGHTLILQPELLEELYAVHPSGNKNSNAYKAAKSKLLTDRQFVTLIEQDELDRGKAAKMAIRRHSLTSKIFGGETEISIVWVDEDTGVLCKARIDAPVKGVGIWDLKFTTDLSDRAIARKVGDFRYDLQAAFYGMGAAAVGLDVKPAFGFAWCESEGVHDIRTDEVSGRVLVAAEAELDELLEQWARCHDGDSWPGRPETITSLPVPYDLEKEIAWRVGEMGVAA